MLWGRWQKESADDRAIWVLFGVQTDPLGRFQELFVLRQPQQQTMASADGAEMSWGSSRTVLPDSYCVWPHRGGEVVTTAATW